MEQRTNPAQRTLQCIRFLRADGSTASSSPQCRWSAFLDPSDKQPATGDTADMRPAPPIATARAKDQHENHQTMEERHATASAVQAVTHSTREPSAPCSIVKTPTRCRPHGGEAVGDDEHDVHTLQHHATTHCGESMLAREHSAAQASCKPARRAAKR